MQGTGAAGDGESGMGANVPPGDLGQQGTAGQGMGYPRGQHMRYSRALGTAGQSPTSFQGTKNSRRGHRVPLGTEGQGTSKGWGTAGQASGSLQGTRRQRQPQVQPNGFPLFLRPFVPQFPSSQPLLRAGTGSGMGRGGQSEHVALSRACLPSTHTRHFYVSIQPPVGELMAPVFMSENEFKKEQGEWGDGDRAAHGQPPSQRRCSPPILSPLPPSLWP